MIDSWIAKTVYKYTEPDGNELLLFKEILD